MSTNGRTPEFSHSLAAAESDRKVPDGPSIEPKIAPDRRSSPLHLPTVRESEFLPPIGRWTTLGGLFTVGAMGVALLLAGVTEYNVTVQARASVRPVGELRLVQATTEGTVKSIRVKENQAVKKGDVMATLDDSRLQTQVSQLRSQIQQGELQLTRVNAQIQAIEAQMVAESDRSARAVDSARSELGRSQREYRDRQLTALATVREAGANVRSARDEWLRAGAELKAARADLKAAEAARAIAYQRSERYQKVEREGALSRDQLDEARSAVAQQEQVVEARKATIEAQERTIERLDRAIDAATARLQQARVTLDPTRAAVAIAEAAVEREKAAGEATRASLQRERESLLRQKIALQQQLQRDNRQRRQMEIDIARTRIVATSDGIIARLNLRNTGQTVRSGDEIARIVPAMTPLNIEADVPPSDIGKLKTGQRVQMRVSACPYPDYGTLKGVVSKISQDTIALSGNDPSRSLTAYYKVAIEPESLILGQKDNRCTVKLGMEGRADIISSEETVLHFLLRKARLLADTPGGN